MDGYVYSTTAPPDAVKALLANPPAQPDYLLQESATDITFERFSTPGQDWKPWDAGRAFGQKIEVRWQWVDDGMFQLLVLSEARLEALANWPEPKRMEAEDGGRVYLWGRERSFLTGVKRRDVPPEWVQASIPRPLCYPLAAAKEFAYIETVDYRWQGMIILTRFWRVDGEDREEARQ
jgi:hypothetical protein